ncbi:MAG: molybdopterin molybdotransferase MoeA [Myxococcales bacterium]|nr:molybdopterin molybdotransferase MoeA [Myxococcales bacterium]
MAALLTIEEAQANVLRLIAAPDVAAVDRVPLSHANWRVCATDLTASQPSPRFDNSAMDGFAVRAAETAAGSARLPIAGTVAAGDANVPPLRPGTALRILTGAPMPEGADAVAMYEHCDETLDAGASWVTVPATPLGQHIRRRGEDIAVGDLLLRAGAMIDAADIMVLASQGRPQVPVYPQPRVAIISTGDELVELSERPRPGQLFDANSYGMAALVSSCGGQPFRMGIAKDDVAEIAAQIVAAHADAVVITGGISGSERDHVQAALARAGATLDLWQVAMKPGKPFAFARLGHIPVFAVPGNPVSAATSFELFVRPALMKMMGASSLQRPTLKAMLTSTLAATAARAQVVRLSLDLRGGSVLATPHPKQGSGMLSSLLHWHAYAIMDAHQAARAAGEQIEVFVRTWPQPR